MSTTTVRCNQVFELRDENGRKMPALIPAEIAAEYSVYHFFSYEVVDGVAYVSLPLGVVTTAQLIYIESTEELTLKLNNDSNIVFPIEKVFLLHSTTGLTQLDVLNESGSTATLRGYIFGE